ncbi:MAG: AMIN domain-containing protein [Myxococcota bacterium]
MSRTQVPLTVAGSLLLAAQAVAVPSRPLAPTAPATALQVAQAGSEGSASDQRAMTYVGFRNLPGQSEVFARLTASASHEVRREGDNLLVLEIKNAVIPLDNNKNHLDSTFFDSPVKMITPTEVEDTTPSIRIIVEMKEDVPYRTEQRGNEIAVIFQRPS